VEHKSLFGTSGIRGDAEKLFTNQFCFDIGRTFAIFLKNNDLVGKIAVGCDPRISSPRIRAAFASGVIYEGFEVFDEGVTPIPSINCILLNEPSFIGSVMVTGSHIQTHLNGLKFFAFSEEILKEHERAIDEIYLRLKEEIKYTDKAEAIIQDDQAIQDYKEYLLSKAKKPYPFWKIIVDPGNGAQSDVMPWVLRQLRLEVFEINASLQQELLSRDTEVKGDYKELQESVVKEKADFGIGYDSDGDRVIFVDEEGQAIVGDHSGALIAQGQPGEWLVTPVNSSKVVELIGKKVARTKVGSPYVVAKMKELKASFGFEANGGGIFSEMHSRDGGRSTIEMLNLLSEKGMKLSELVATLPKYYQSRDKVEYEWELKDKIISSAKKVFKGIKVDEMDGLKIWLNDDTWILFRSSANAPEFRVFTESKSEREAEELLARGIKFVKDIIENK
jgi:phosphomannomutase/phosphoglucomutase